MYTQKSIDIKPEKRHTFKLEPDNGYLFIYPFRVPQNYQYLYACFNRDTDKITIFNKDAKYPHTIMVIKYENKQDIPDIDARKILLYIE